MKKENYTTTKIYAPIKKFPSKQLAQVYKTFAIHLAERQIKTDRDLHWYESEIFCTETLIKFFLVQTDANEMFLKVLIKIKRES